MTPAQKNFLDSLQLLRALKEFQNTRDSQLMSQLWEVAWQQMIDTGKQWLAESQMKQ